MKRTIELHGVPMDLGANLRGVDMGPSALRIAGLESALRELGHEVIDRDEMEIRSRVSLAAGDAEAKFLEAIVKACERLADVAERAAKTRFHFAQLLVHLLAALFEIGVGVLL